jgi:hypothetical protein
MKYTEEQKKRLKRKGILTFHKHNFKIPSVTIVDGFYIVESKMNQK